MTHDQRLGAAIALHREGRLSEAEPLYLKAMAETPDQFGPPYFLGLVRLQQGRNGEAAALLERALLLQPRNVHGLIQHGVALHRLGRNEDALTRFDAVLEFEPDQVDVHYHRALALAQLGRADESLESLGRATALMPDNAMLHMLTGLILTDLQRMPEAEASYDRAIALQPDMADALSNRGQLAWARGDTGAALADYDKALAADADHVAARANRATVLAALGRLGDALADYDRVLALLPGEADIWNRRGATLRALSRSREALESFDRAVGLQPDFPAALNNRGFLRWVLDQDYAGARADLERALALDPGFPFLAGELFYLKMQAADWQDYARGAEALAAGVAAGRKIVRPFAYQAISADPASLQQCARLFTAEEYPPVASAPLPARTRRGEKIRIGYLSADFREQATAYLMAGVYEAHDRGEFEIIAVDNGPDEDSDMRRRLKAGMDRFIPIAGVPDDEAAASIRDAGIDILVNLNGYFGKPRMGVFARRPAPLQVNYLGFPATLGAPYMDYIIADRVVIPEQERRFYDESVVWLPDCYQANDRRRPRPAPSRRADVGLPEHGFVFCNFNQAYKIAPDLFAVWMRLLREVPGSVLWLYQDNETATANLRRHAADAGVAAERLIFARTLPLDQHLARVACADLALDTLPYNAHTTASDALWAGVPLVTCRGTAFPGRVAASLLMAAGLPQLVTDSLDAYAKLALALANDPARLAAHRAHLEQNRLRLPLFDTERFTRGLEEAYRAMWRRHLAGEAPAAFAV